MSKTAVAEGIEVGDFNAPTQVREFPIPGHGRLRQGRSKEAMADLEVGPIDGGSLMPRYGQSDG
jgi:hypothetical protein